MTTLIARSRSHVTNCRVCGTPLEVVFANLGMIPLCQSYITADHLLDSEPFYPLRATACMKCYYVGLPEYLSPEAIFTEYAYFSSTSTSWLDYIDNSAAELIQEFKLDENTQVVEMASNDGYLLRHFVSRGIPAIGVEPAVNVAKAANAQGLTTVPMFFNSDTARFLLKQGHAADLLLTYNSLDHVPDLSDVIAGMKLLLKRRAAIQIEVPYLVSMVEHSEFDTIYHDRFSYFSLLSLTFALEMHELRVFHAGRIPTHGGSIRVRACHSDDASRPTQPSVSELLDAERRGGITTREYYEGFSRKKQQAKFEILNVLIDLKKRGHSIVGYGVPAKGNVLLNYCGIRDDLLDYLVDRSAYKRGKYAPGSRLQIRDVEQVRLTKPDYLVILPWNIKDEIIEQMSFIREWGGKFIVPIPRVEVI